MTIRLFEIKRATTDALVKASTSFRPDQVDAFELAIQNETDGNAKWVLELILENARLAKEKKLPLCDDTGIPYIQVDIGDEVEIEGRIGELFSAVREGVIDGLSILPGRPMAVRGNDLERLAQTKGLFDESAMLEAAPIRITTTSGQRLRITVLMLGGGPEIRSRTYRVYHHHQVSAIRDEIIKWASEMVGLLGCTPSVAAVGIGRTHYEANCLTMEALVEATFGEEDDLAKSITAAVNNTRVGPLGLGGKTSILSTFIKVGPQRASGVRIVNLRMGCCYDPRKMTVELQ